jgi:2-phospho-L-lactate guanylyltransferase
MPQGTIKHFDPTTREGSLMTEDQTEIHVDATSVEGAGILTLRIGQRVRFDLVDEGGRKVARTLRIVTF